MKRIMKKWMGSQKSTFKASERSLCEESPGTDLRAALTKRSLRGELQSRASQPEAASERSRRDDMRAPKNGSEEARGDPAQKMESKRQVYEENYEETDGEPEKHFRCI